MRRAFVFAILLTALVAGSAVAKPTPPPLLRTHGGNAVPGQALFVAAPTGFTATTSATTCTQHAGALGALVCKTIAQSGWMVLVWNWSACGSADCVKTIGGYHVYRAGSSSSKPALLATVANPQQTVYATASYAVGQCFTVRAYAGSRESRDSNRYCAGGAPGKPPVFKGTLPTPTPLPKPVGWIPQTRTIAITGDAFPANLTIAAGDTVRWTNEDDDAHTVTSDPGWTFNAVMGGSTACKSSGSCSVQYRFTTPGVYRYSCTLHSGMRGQITVVNHAVSAPAAVKKGPKR